MKKLSSKILLTLCALAVMSVPAYAEFAALERGLAAGRIINSVSDSAYLDGNGNAITEAAIADLSSADYGKTGLVADGNTRLILRFQSEKAGTVKFSVSPSIAGSKLEALTDRTEITGSVSTVSAGNVNQASAVFIAPETWPDNINYPSGEFTVTAALTPSDGSSSVSESLTLTLQAPPVVLIHGAFGTNERMFGYTKGTKKQGVWQKLEDAGLKVVSWNYDNEKSPKAVIANNNNGLAKILAQTFDELNSQDIAATRADLVTHSTGGLMARQYLRSDIDTGNKTANSYGLGTVRRVITIASPNLGSNISSFSVGSFDKLPQSWKEWDAHEFWENTVQPALYNLIFVRKKAQEVMHDTALDSDYITGLTDLGYPKVPFHSIYGKVSKDQDKFYALLKIIMSDDRENSLKNAAWLPENIVNLLIAKNLSVVSAVLNTAEELGADFGGLLRALFGNEDHDLVVNEASAKSILPSNAVTSYEGIVNYNHVLIAQQDDVGEKVCALLKGSTDSFMINTAVSTQAYDRVFDAAVSDFSPKKFTTADSSWTDYLGKSLDIDIDGTADAQGIILINDISLDIAGSSDVNFSGDIMFRIAGEDGAAKFLIWNLSNDSSFDVEFNNSDDEIVGIFKVSYMISQDGKVRMSDTITVAVPPEVSGKVTSLSSVGTVYVHVGDETPLGLVAHTSNGNYDISAPVFKIASYEIADSSIAEITENGNVKALKEGSTEITATADGKTAKINVVVLSSSSVEDATKDLGDNSSSSSSSSSGGGCNAGFGALILLSALVLSKKIKK